MFTVNMKFLKQITIAAIFVATLAVLASAQDVTQPDAASKTAKFGSVKAADASVSNAIDAHDLKAAGGMVGKSGAFKGTVTKLVEDAQRMQITATGLPLTDALKADLSAVIAKHGGTLEGFGHPSTTLEKLFLRVVDESRARPGRRYLPPTAPLEAVSKS